MGRTQTENTTEPIRALDPRFYTDPEVFTQEKERIFFRTWQYACHEGEIENPGDFVVFDIADQSLFVMRDANSVLRCFYNVCQHRAHELLQGKGNRKLIICPYHAWTYHLNGRLKAARNTTAVRDFDASKICLSEIKVEVFCGFVFVNLDSDAAPMNDWYPNAAQDLASYVPDIDRYRLLWAHNADEHCNWKVAVENYNECYHCRVVHPSFTKGVIAPQSVDIVPQGYTLRHSAQGVVSDKASYSFDDTTYRVIYLWPTMSIQIYPGRVVNTYWWRPKSLTQTQVYRGWLTPDGKEDPETMKIAELDRNTTFSEDLPVLNSVQRGLSSHGYKPGPLVLDPNGGVDNERSVHAIHCWVREALGE